MKAVQLVKHDKDMQVVSGSRSGVGSCGRSLAGLVRANKFSWRMGARSDDVGLW